MNCMKIPKIKTAMGAVLMLWFACGAMAGEVAISPLRVDFYGDVRMSVVELTNTGVDKLAMQVQPMDWSQDFTGKDRYDVSEELVAFPPIFSIQPGETQVVRVAAQKPASADIEQAYRLFFTEIPAPLSDKTPTALRMRLRISIPVFDAPDSGLDPEMEMENAWFDEGILKVRLKNTGNSHLRAQSLQVAGIDGISSVGVGRYFLPGSSHEFSVDLGEDARISSIQVNTDLLGDVRFKTDGLAEPPVNLVAKKAHGAAPESWSSAAPD